jgi:iron-sulfur cluster repair protein YtfE (RIC family)
MNNKERSLAEEITEGLDALKRIRELEEKDTRKMNLKELIEALDQRYGNPHAKECALIQEAIKVLKLQSEEITALMEQVNAK